MDRFYHQPPHILTEWSGISSPPSLSGTHPLLRAPFQNPSCIYRFLISSKAKWSTPTDSVLMTLRLGPVVQKTHCFYLSSWFSAPPALFRWAQRGRALLEVRKHSCGRAGQGPQISGCPHTHFAASTHGLCLQRPSSRDSQAGERSNTCARWS